MTSQAPPAWNVVNVRWPVSAAWRRDLGRRPVADLADGDDLGILAEQRLEARLEAQPGGRVDLRLGDAGHDRLDGVLEGGEAALAGPPGGQLAEAGVDGRGLAAARRPGQDDRAEVSSSRCERRVANLGGQAQVVQSEEPAGRREHPHDGLLAEDGREGGEPHLHLARNAADPALLRHVGPVGQQLGHHLEPGDDVGRDPGRHLGDRLEHAVDPPAQLQPVASGLPVHVAGTRLLRLGQHAVDDLGRIPRTGRIELGQGFSQACRCHGGSDSLGIGRLRVAGSTGRLSGLPASLDGGRGFLGMVDGRPGVQLPAALDPLEPDGLRRTFGDQQGAVRVDLLAADHGDPSLRPLDPIARLEPPDLRLFGEGPNPLDRSGGAGSPRSSQSRSGSGSVTGAASPRRAPRPRS